MKKKICIILTILCVVSLLIACGSNAKSNEAYDVGFAYESPKEADAVNGSPKEVDAVNSGTTEEKSQTNDYLSTQKLVYTCKLNIETLEFNNTLAKIKELINQYNGFIEYEQTTDESYDWYYSSYKKDVGFLKETIKVRIPSEKYAAFVDGVSGVGKVLSKSESVDNITKQYNDTQTTIESLKIQEARLLEMMESAKTIDEMITVESRLSQVQRQLESYQSSLSGMDMDVQFSTVNITLKEVIEYSPEVEELTFGEEIIKAIKDSGSGFVSFLKSFLIIIIYLAPFLILVGIIAFIVLMAIKASRKKKQVVNQQTKTTENIKEDNSVNNQV